MEEYELTLQASSDFLQTMSDFGYQIALVKEDGENNYVRRTFSQ